MTFKELGSGLLPGVQVRSRGLLNYKMYLRTKVFPLAAQTVNEGEGRGGRGKGWVRIVRISGKIIHFYLRNGTINKNKRVRRQIDVLKIIFLKILINSSRFHFLSLKQKDLDLDPDPEKKQPPTLIRKRSMWIRIS